MDITWKKIELEDKGILLPYLKQAKQRNCELTFSNLYLWSKWFPTTYAIINDMLVFHGAEEDGFSLTFPLGESEKEKEALTMMEEYCKEQGQALRMHIVSKEQFARLEEYFPNTYQIEFDADKADYVYERERLLTLSGKKLHSKRNHINRFKEDFAGRWSYEAICVNNVEECFQMALKWRTDNGCDEDREKNQEMCVTLNSLRLFQELELKGGLIRVDGEVVAFAIGEEATEDTFIVHIEKAFAHVQGAYPLINQQFVEHEMEAYTYVNREEDTGVEGIRKAKLSYQPVFMVEKGFVTKLKEINNG